MINKYSKVEKRFHVFAEEQSPCHHNTCEPAEKKYSPDWDFGSLYFLKKAHGLRVNIVGLTDISTVKV